MNGELPPSLYKRMLDDSEDWETLIDADGRLRYSSRAIERFSGLRVEDLLQDLAPFFARIHPDDVDRVQQHYRIGPNVKGHGDVTFRLLNADGTYIWLHHTCGPLHDAEGVYLGQRGSTREITGLRDYQQRLDLLLALHSISAAFMRLHASEYDEGIQRGLNLALNLIRADAVVILRTTDAPDEYTVAEYWERTTTEGGRPPGAPSIDERITGQTCRLPWVARWRGQADTLWWNKNDALPVDADQEIELFRRFRIETACAHPLRLDDRVAGYVILVDWSGELTHETQSLLFMQLVLDLISGMLVRRELEVETERNHLMLEQAFSAMVNATRAKDVFLRTISHELRTPLTSIIGLTELLQMQPDEMTARQVHYLDLISDSGTRLLTLIRDLLDIADMSRGEVSPPHDLIQLELLTTSAMLETKVAARLKQHVVECHLRPPSISLIGDSSRIQHAIVHLLTNAIKFTPSGGRISLDASYDPAENMIHISISDTGIGIDPADVPKLFTPFWQLDSRLERSAEGAGIGLSLVKRTAELHGGSVSVSSVPGQGSTFTIHLPGQGAARGGNGGNEHGDILGNEHGEILGDEHGEILGDEHGEILGDEHGEILGNEHGGILANEHGGSLANEPGGSRGNEHGDILGNEHGGSRRNAGEASRQTPM